MAMKLVFIILLHTVLKITGDDLTNCPPLKTCNWTYPTYVTEDLKCKNHFNCPDDYLCCPDCYYKHHICKKAIRNCPPEQRKCPNKIPYQLTRSYQCYSDHNCQEGYICCADDCYYHKICKQLIIKVEDDLSCPEDPRACDVPFPRNQTYQYECNAEKTCDSGHVCCSDTCYTHKICKISFNTTIVEYQIDETIELCPPSVREGFCPQKKKTSSQYSCKNDEDCFFGYKCCQDNCYAHKVCKLPLNAFAYTSAFKSASVSTLADPYGCPKVATKCDQPYSLRLAKKFMCFSDSDCKIGQFCCKDACVKDFKICRDVFTTPAYDEVEVTSSIDDLIDSGSGMDAGSGLHYGEDVFTTLKTVGSDFYFPGE